MLINKTPLRILGINPGWRYLAIAVFDNSELREWRLKGLEGKGMPKKKKKVNEILSALIDRYGPNILAIKKLHPSRCSVHLVKLAAEIRDYCSKRGMKISSYSIGDLEDFLFPGERINKTRLAQSLAANFPALKHEWIREEQNRNPYFIRLFEAVALGLVCYRRNNRNN